MKVLFEVTVHVRFTGSKNPKVDFGQSLSYRLSFTAAELAKVKETFFNYKKGTTIKGYLHNFGNKGDAKVTLTGVFNFLGTLRADSIKFDYKLQKDEKVTRKI